MANLMASERHRGAAGRSGAARTSGAVAFLQSQSDTLQQQLRAAEDRLRRTGSRRTSSTPPSRRARRSTGWRSCSPTARRGPGRPRCLCHAHCADARRHRRRRPWRAVAVAPAHGVPHAAAEPVGVGAPRRAGAGRVAARRPAHQAHAAGLRRPGAHGAHPRDRGAAPGHRRVVRAEPRQPGGVARRRGGRSFETAARRAAGKGAAGGAARARRQGDSTTSGCSCRRGSRRRRSRARWPIPRCGSSMPPRRRCGPSSPKLPVNLALSLVLGTMVGVTLALAREYGDRSVRSRDRRAGRVGACGARGGSTHQQAPTDAAAMAAP